MALASAAGCEFCELERERGLQANASAPTKANAMAIRMFMNPGGGEGWPPVAREPQ